jgi:hypothetical protein
MLISFRDLKAPHSGENITKSVKAVCEEYNIMLKIRYCVLNNADNNDTCV